MPDLTETIASVNKESRSPGTVRTMLRNEAYTGEHWWGANRYELARDPHGGPKRIVSVRPEEERVRMTGFTPMIIEPQMFWAVQQVALRKPRRGKEWDYFLTDFFYCGQCGSNVCGGTARAGQQKRAYTYSYYRCEGTLGDFSRPKICDLRMVRADRLEPKVKAALLEVVRNPECVFEEMARRMEGEDSDLDRAIASLKGQLRTKTKDIQTLTYQRTQRHIRQSDYEALLGPLNLGRDRLEEELALLSQQKGDIDDLGRVREAMRTAFTRYSDALDDLDGAGLTTLLRLLQVRVTIMPGRRVLVTGVIDAGLLTIAQTWASQHARSRRCRWA